MRIGDLIFRLIALTAAFFLPHAAADMKNTELNSIKSQSKSHVQPAIEPQSGLVNAEGVNTVLAHCSACHSPSLITQNAMSRERWLETIRWMQDTQKLWPLGDAEPVILDYLSTWYGPKTSARRPHLAPHLLPKTGSAHISKNYTNPHR
ncbi:hypothetical protein KUL156_21900 [Alteromonas sp. KUL156]|nr:hypothetical protein KUL156_21900 [Alteromonas sp. KUL156]